jgi:protein-histidine pros-kinase
MNPSQTKKVHVAFSIVLVTFAGIGLLAWHTLLTFRNASRQVTHTRDVITGLEKLVADVEQLDPAELDRPLAAQEGAPESAARALLKQTIARLQNLTAANPLQAARVTHLDSTLEKMLLSNQPGGAGVRDQTAGSEHGSLRKAEWRRLRKAFRTTVYEMMKTEHGVLIQRQATEHTTRQRVAALVGMGSVLALLFVSVSWRRIARDTLRHQQDEQRFRNLLESAPDAMLIIDPAGKIGMVNAQAERLLGYPKEDLVAKPIELLVPERFRATHADHVAAYFKSPRARPLGAGLELHALRRDGAEIPVEISLSPMQSDQGTTVTASIRDVTERKVAESIHRQFEAELQLKNRELERQSSMLQKANRLKSEFLANMSHELRTPLNAIIGFSELMHDGKLGPVSAAHQEYLGDILASARHLQELINDILDLSKVEAGKIEFRPQPVQLSRITGEVREILQTQSAGKRISVSLDIAPEAEEVVLDPAKLKQVLYNYLSNALKFTPEGGQVIVRARAEDPEMFRIEVEDNGIGIHAADINKLFVEFQQLDSSAGKRHQGTGLGLALTKSLVEAQGGRVGASSVLGRGSVFYAVLPKTFSASNGSKPHAEKAGAPAVVMGTGSTVRPGAEEIDRATDG